jgi:glycosyltransferase involved in cell wall biosynthesis
MSALLHVVVLNPYGYELFEPTARSSRVFGGAEVQLYYLATALAADPAVAVTMVVERPHTGPLRDIVEGVAMRFVRPTPLLDWVRRWLPLPSTPYIRAVLRARPDVVVQRGGAVLTADAALAAQLRRIPFVFMAAHDWDATLAHVRGHQRLSGLAYVRAVRRASLVIAQTSEQAALLRHWHRIEAPVLRSALPASHTVPREDLGDGPVLWVGRGLTWKRPEAFLDLAESLPGRRFVMVCPSYAGEQELAQRVRARAALLANVEFVEFLPFRETERLFAAAAIVVNTSVAEGFPNTFMQATRVGTPVASLSVDADDIIRREGIGVVGDGETGVLSDRVEALLADRVRWAVASRAARRVFAEQHDLGVVSTRFVKALRDVAGRK